MAHQALKRQVEDSSDSNDNLNDDEYDVTWGGKRCRYMYNYSLQSPNYIPPSPDSDQTESVHSGQSKETIEAISEIDSASDRSCGSDCLCQDSKDSSDSVHTEFEVVSSSSYNFDFKFSDSSTSYEVQVKKIDDNVYDKVFSDKGYSADENTDTLAGFYCSKNNLPPPACFKRCLQCKERNPNPYFQYCHSCFRNREDFFVQKPKPKKSKQLRFRQKEKLLRKDLSMQISQRSNEIGVSSSLLSRNENKNSTDLNTEMLDPDMCNVCNTMPKNGVFNHGKVGHIFCCYTCAKVLLRKSDKCPLCNVRIKYVTKMIIV